MPSDFVLSILVILLATTVTDVFALRCKCTKESESVKCDDGVCETDGSCLMLDHPSMGIHYTCHTRGLKDGSCHNRTSKSGSSVRICGCNGADFCNFSMWPDKTAHKHQAHHHEHHHHHDTENQEVVNSSFQGKMSSFIALIVLLIL